MPARIQALKRKESAVVQRCSSRDAHYHRGAVQPVRTNRVQHNACRVHRSLYLVLVLDIDNVDHDVLREGKLVDKRSQLGLGPSSDGKGEGSTVRVALQISDGLSSCDP